MVEEPATDGDPDHADSEATVDSKNSTDSSTSYVLLVNYIHYII